MNPRSNKLTKPGKLILLSAIALALTGSAALAAMFGAEGDFSSLGSSLSWEPSCDKPTRPFELDEYTLPTYQRAIRTYVSCVDDQAAEDAKYAVRTIQEGRDEAIEELRQDIQRRF